MLPILVDVTPIRNNNKPEVCPAKSMVVYGGVGVGSNRPATNFPGIPMDSNRFDCLVETSGIGVEPRDY